MGQMATDEPPANPGALLKGSTSNLKHNASDSATTALDMQPPSFAAWSPGPFMTEVNDEQSLHKKVVEFITKMTHVVLRSRIGPLDQLQPPAPSANFREQLAYIDGNALLGHTDFWRNTMPVNLDIFINDTKVLLERWVISHESFPDLAKPHEERFSLKKADLTDLMLLVQSLYSYIRLMPLHAILADSVQLEKRDLRYCVSTADGCSFSPSFDQNGHIHSALLKVLGKAADANGGDSGDDSSGTGRSSRLGSVMSSPQTTLPSVEEDWMTSNYRRSESSDYFGTGSCHSSAASSSPPSSPSAFVPVAFDMSAKLKVYKFKAASTNRGRLHLSVVYDSSVGGLVTPTLTSSRLGTSPVKASPTKPLMKAKESAADNSNAQQSTDKDLFHQVKPSRPASAPVSGSRRSSASLGSPFPSPTMQKRVARVSQWKLASLERAKSSSASGLGGNDANGGNCSSNGIHTSTPFLPSNMHEDPFKLPEAHNRESISREYVSDVHANGSSGPVGIPFGQTMPPMPPLLTSSINAAATSPADKMMTDLNATSPFTSATFDRHPRQPRPDLQLVIPPLQADFPLGGDQPDHGRRDFHGDRQRHHHRQHHRHGNTHSHHAHQSSTHHGHPHTAHHSHHHHSSRRSSMDLSPSATTTIRSINIPLNPSPFDRDHFFTTMAMISTAAQAISPTASLIKTPSDLHGSLVGSYEESILTGRMSSLPSKPILFLAEIGVVGHGKCPPGLRCPPHVSAPFNAFYYEVGEEESVTPYVGCVDVAAAASASANALQEAASRDAMGIDVAGVSNRHNGDNPRRPKRDGYRIPPKGQLQIVIKNPSRTAIKLFLLPYDFRDMPPNSKTILRQKSYSFSGTPGTSTSSVPSTPISHQKSGTASVSTTTTAAGVRHHSKDPFESTNTHLAPHSTEAKPPRPHSASVTPTHHAKPPIHPSTTPSTTTTPSPAKQHLRYAIHIPIFRTAKSVYIGPTLRVVFSHRAVDGDEKVVVVSEGFGTGEGRYVAFGAGFR